MKVLLTIFTTLFFGGQALAQADMGTDAQREAGKLVYDQKCSQCHGDNGAGDGVAAAYFRPAPRNFTTGTFKFRTTASGELPSHADIVNSIREGMPYTGMPAWPGLSESELNNLAYYIKTFASDFSGPFGKPDVVDFEKVPSFSSSHLERGREVYLENQCSDCHGSLGRGDGKSAKTLEDQWGFHIKPADLTKRWTFRGGGTRQDIYQTFTTGLDGSPMPSYEIDPPEDKWALVDYVYSLSEDEIDYATMAVVTHANKPISVNASDSLFVNSEFATFPIVGQVVEPGRAFFPGVNSIDVAGVYDSTSIALMLAWNDMSQEAGSNAPDLPVLSETDSTSGGFSDAVMVQFPTMPPAGIEKPYFMTGDTKAPVDLWFVDLGSSTASRYTGKGSENIVPNNDNTLEVSSNYVDGRWTVILKYSRPSEGEWLFTEDTFVPVAFSVWDGFYAEHGNKRGLSSWYSLYIAPAEVESPVMKMAGYGLLTFLFCAGLVFLTRRKFSESDIT